MLHFYFYFSFFHPSSIVHLSSNGMVPIAASGLITIKITESGDFEKKKEKTSEHRRGRNHRLRERKLKTNLPWQIREKHMKRRFSRRGNLMKSVIRCMLFAVGSCYLLDSFEDLKNILQNENRLCLKLCALNHQECLHEDLLLSMQLLLCHQCDRIL